MFLFRIFNSLYRNPFRFSAMFFLFLAGFFLTACSEKEPQAVKISAKPVIEAELERFNRLAEQLFQNAVQRKTEEVKNQLTAMGALVTQMRFEGMTSLEGMNALIDCIIHAQEIYNAAKFDEQKGYIAIAKIRLAADALTHEHQPIWLEYEQILKEDIARLKQAVNKGQTSDALQAVRLFSTHYDLIRPAALIQREPQAVEKVDSLLTFLRRQLNHQPIQKDYVESGIQHLETSVVQLFGTQNTTAYLPLAHPFDPVKWMTGLGALIAVALAYSGWRMYRYEKRKGRDRERGTGL